MKSFKEYKKRLKSYKPTHTFSRQHYIEDFQIERGFYDEEKHGTKREYMRKLRFKKRYRIRTLIIGNIKYAIRVFFRYRIKNFFRFVAYIPRHIGEYFSSVKWEMRQYKEPFFKAMKNVRKRNKEDEETLSYMYWRITHQQSRIRKFIVWMREKIIIKFKRCYYEVYEDTCRKNGLCDHKAKHAFWDDDGSFMGYFCQQHADDISQCDWEARNDV